MKFGHVIVSSLAVAAGPARAVAVAVPDSEIAERQPDFWERDAPNFEEFWKRRGGGGGGGRGGGGGGGGSSSGGSSSGGSSSGGSSSGGSSGSGSSGSSGSKPGGSSSSGSSGSSSGSSGGRGSSSSSSGGRTTTGSGPPPSYGGGGYYGGGSRAPYTSGGRSPSGITPFLLGGAVGGAAAVAFWPGHWYHPVYYYPYHHPYGYYNTSSGKNESKPVGCGCDQTVECGCDEDNNSTTVLKELVGNGSYANLNQSLVTVADVNGTSTILINGTLPNGTTANGGTEDPNAAGGLHSLLMQTGWWPAVATVCALVLLV